MQLTKPQTKEKVIKNLIDSKLIQEFENILIKKEFLLKEHIVETSSMTVSKYINNFSPVININPDYQRCTEDFSIDGENRWTYSKKKEYIISLITGLAPTLFIIVDYNSCKNNLTDEEKIENDLYFQNLIGNGYKYGLLDGGHRNNVLNLLLKKSKSELVDKETNLLEKLLNDIASEFNIQVDQIKTLLLNSKISYTIYKNLNRKEIHYLFRNANSGVPLSTNEFNTSIISPMNDYIQKLKRDSTIKYILGHIDKREKILAYYILPLCYYFEINKEKNTYTKKDIENFLINEIPNNDLIQKQNWIFENIEKLYELYFNNSLTKKTFSSTKFVSLYMILSIIYDENKNINPKRCLSFIRIFSDVICRYSDDITKISLSDVKNNKRDSWHDRFRSNGGINKKWELFSNIYIDKGKYNFKNVSQNSSSIQDYLI